MITEKMQNVANLVNSKFVYEKDGRIDSWHILDTSKEVVKGDCDDYSLTVAYELSNRNFFIFLFNVIFLRFVFWYSKSSSGNPHIILKHKGYYIDNIEPKWSKTTSSKTIFPAIFPIPVLKILIGYIIRK